MADSDNRYYDKDFYFKKNFSLSYRSALETIPYILRIVNPKSIVDLGCGSGTWIKAFQEKGIKETLGIDFHSVKPVISPKNFLKKDLRKPINIGKKFDMAMSLEVAEHVETKYSEIFVENLTSLSDIVLFSAATPRQEGENHINEQWHNFWVDLFKKRGYVALDSIRPHIILNENVSCDYRQNILLFVREKILLKDSSRFLPYYDGSKQLLFRKNYAKQFSIFSRFIYRINNQIFGGLFNGIVDKIFLRRFFGDIASVDVKYLKKMKVY